MIINKISDSYLIDILKEVEMSQILDNRNLDTIQDWND